MILLMVVACILWKVGRSVEGLVRTMPQTGQDQLFAGLEKNRLGLVMNCDQTECNQLQMVQSGYRGVAS
jgi:hypothetical protein